MLSASSRYPELNAADHEVKGILIDAFRIEYDVLNIIQHVKRMLTGFQIRAARAGLRITAKELAERAGVSLPTIQRFETVDGVPPSRSSTLLDVKAALEAAGVEFIGTPAQGPGIRLWPHKAHAP
jgi:DNA-binding transcriptional regulator YiaG